MVAPFDGDRLTPDINDLWAAQRQRPLKAVCWPLHATSRTVCGKYLNKFNYLYLSYHFSPIFLHNHCSFVIKTKIAFLRLIFANPSGLMEN